MPVPLSAALWSQAVLPSPGRSPRSGRRDPDGSIGGAPLLRPVGNGRRDAGVFRRASFPARPARRARAGRRGRVRRKPARPRRSRRGPGRRRGRAAVGRRHGREAHAAGAVRPDPLRDRPRTPCLPPRRPVAPRRADAGVRARLVAARSRRAAEPIQAAGRRSPGAASSSGTRRWRRLSGRPTRSPRSSRACGSTTAASRPGCRRRRSGSARSTSGGTGAPQAPSSSSAAWLAEFFLGHPSRERERRVDAFAFAQRVFPRGGQGEAGVDADEMVTAVRSFVAYPVLMLTLERMGVRTPAIYAAAAQQAERLTDLDQSRGSIALAQFQGALALLSRLTRVRTIDGATAERLARDLFASRLDRRPVQRRHRGVAGRAGATGGDDDISRRPSAAVNRRLYRRRAPRRRRGPATARSPQGNRVGGTALSRRCRRRRVAAAAARARETAARAFRARARAREACPPPLRDACHAGHRARRGSGADEGRRRARAGRAHRGRSGTRRDGARSRADARGHQASGRSVRRPQGIRAADRRGGRVARRGAAIAGLRVRAGRSGGHDSHRGRSVDPPRLRLRPAEPRRAHQGDVERGGHRNAKRAVAPGRVRRSRSISRWRRWRSGGSTRTASPRRRC